MRQKVGFAADGEGLVLAPMAAAPPEAKSEMMEAAVVGTPNDAPTGRVLVEPATRREFADTALWAASLTTDENGVAEVEFSMPENLTGWSVRAWALGHGTVVGEGASEVVTAKDLILRLQAPRFFVETDEVCRRTSTTTWNGRSRCGRCWNWPEIVWSPWGMPGVASRCLPGAKSGSTGGSRWCGRGKRSSA